MVTKTETCTDTAYQEIFNNKTVAYFANLSKKSQSLILKKTAFCTECIYAVCIDLRTNGDYSIVQHLSCLVL